MKKLWRRYPSTILSLLFLVGAVIYGWYDGSQQRTILGVTDERGFESALVARVIDGDTIKLDDGRTVRYIGIDTPELSRASDGSECFAQEALEQNKMLVEGKVVQLEKDVNETDRYGRLLRYVWIDDAMVNHSLVLDGFAVARSYPPDVQYQVDLQVAERAARYDSRGLWGGCEQ